MLLPVPPSTSASSAALARFIMSGVECTPVKLKATVYSASNDSPDADTSVSGSTPKSRAP